MATFCHLLWNFCLQAFVTAKNIHIKWQIISQLNFPKQNKTKAISYTMTKVEMPKDIFLKM
jgi:hypothetical protein